MRLILAYLSAACALQEWSRKFLLERLKLHTPTRLAIGCVVVSCHANPEVAADAVLLSGVCSSTGAAGKRSMSRARNVSATTNRGQSGELSEVMPQGRHARHFVE